MPGSSFRSAPVVFLVVLTLIALSYPAFSLSCTTDEDCPTAAYCENTTSFTCMPKKPLGSICTENRECLTGLCSNGVCVEDVQIPLEEWRECTPAATGDYCEREIYIGIESDLPRGCRSDEMCSSSFGYYCYTPRYLCIKCPEADTVNLGENVSSNLFCPSKNCIGFDPDCCATDGDCKASYYCNNASNTCLPCKAERDFFCPSQKCYDIDEDCCIASSDCPGGYVCTEGTCLPAIGLSCDTDAECGDSMVCVAGRCALKDFLSFQLQWVSFTGDWRTVYLQLRNPVAVPAKIFLKIESAGRKYAYFPGEPAATLGVNTTILVPVKVLCPEEGLDGFPLKVIAAVGETAELEDDATILVTCHPAGKRAPKEAAAPTPPFYFYAIALLTLAILRSLKDKER